MALTFQRAVPVLRMFDIAKTREFYVNYLGFSVDFEHRFNDESPLFMGFSRDGLTFFVSEHHGDGSPGAHVVVQMCGVDDLHRELAAKHYRYMKPGIQTQDWGMRELCVVDPCGNKIIFSEPVSP